MSFEVHENNTASRSTLPFLLNVQNDLCSQFATRIVVPITHIRPARSPFDPSIEVVINDTTHFCLIPQLTAVRTESLGRVVTTLVALEYEIKRAIDRMFGGW